MKKKIIILSIPIITIDQISKLLASSYISDKIEVIKNFFYLNLVHNEGAAWGLLNKHILFLIIFMLIALALLFHYSSKFINNNRNTIAFSLVIGGLIGNLIDRVFNGYVIDFLDFYIFKYDYPVFNIADICIVIGMLLLIIAILKGEDGSGNKVKNKQHSSR